MDYGDKLPPRSWCIFTPPRRYIIPPPLTGRIEGTGRRWRACLLKNICKLVYFRLETILGGVGQEDENGYLYAADRKMDVIIGGGSNVYEREVEEALPGLDGSTEAAASGIPDGERGSPRPWSAAVENRCLPQSRTTAVVLNLPAFESRYALLGVKPCHPTGNGYGKALERDLCARHAQVP